MWAKPLVEKLRLSHENHVSKQYVEKLRQHNVNRSGVYECNSEILIQRAIQTVGKLGSRVGQRANEIERKERQFDLQAFKHDQDLQEIDAHFDQRPRKISYLC